MMKAERVHIIVLLGVVLAIEVCHVQGYSEGTDNDKTIKKAGEDIDKVITLISKVGAAGALQKDGVLAPGDELVKEELDMLKEDALNLQEKIGSLGNDVDESHRKEDFENDLNNIQADADLLYQDTEDFISDARYDKPEIKTHNDVTFDRDLDLLRNQIGLFLEDSKSVKPENVTTERPTRKRRKNRKHDESKGVTKDSNKIINETQDNHDDMQADPPYMPLMWPDLKCDEALGRRTTAEISTEPTTLALARERSSDLNLSWLSCYLERCPQCTIATQGGQCPLTNQVLEMKKWANEVQELLTHGCVKPAGCTFPGTCCIAGDFIIQQTVGRITEMLKDLQGMFHKKCVSCYDAQQSLGDWIGWSEWSSCDATCGRATRSRFRGCKSGRDCHGFPTETELCAGMPDCCVDGNWANWASWNKCSVTCGRGQMTRWRRCNNPAPSYCGKPCVGLRDDTTFCETNVPCCGEGTWERWASWSACSSSCGEGRRTRTRTCSSFPSPNCRQACLGDAQQVEACSNAVGTAKGNWGIWQSWAACTASCGRGYQTRRRACDSPPPGPCGISCTGTDSETTACDTSRNCCVDGKWGAWHPWSACSATCDIGSRRRRRLCDNPPASYCGKTCQGDDTEMTACITGVPCQTCVDGQWGPWQTWTLCSVTCGQGFHERRRSCDSPPANRCGKTCPGLDRDGRTCETGRQCVVCVNGNWGQWQPWSQCSVTCGRGSHERRRLCDSPQPNYCGSSCPGSASELGSCESRMPCEVCVNGSWGQWQSWSQCSVTCGQGTHERRRLCDSPQPNYCGSSCPGLASDLGSCETRIPCEVCVNGNWGQWQPWSQCSVTCGRGTHERRRLCDSPQPNYCGSSCPGLATDLGSCETRIPCEVCVNGNWGQWQPWSQCSVTCGRGTHERRRLCDSPQPNYCGSSCPGSASDLGSCETRVSCEVCVNGNWGQWQPWSQCSVTCGRGTHERRRLCDSPQPNYCGSSCPGSASDLGSCETRVSCEVCVNGNWGQWQPWSQCSVTCGRGTLERRRLCDSPQPNYCGSNCPGSATDLGSCETRIPCEVCVNGNWGQWQPWSQCSVTCGQGTHERRRLCDSPQPNYCGSSCPGQASDLESCEARMPCEVCVDGNWGSWQSWSGCSMTCGKGTRERRRPCDNPPANDCGQRCSGREFETDVCDTGRECVGCVDGNWGTWQSWGECSVTCGRGTRERLRSCDNPPSNYCGQKCQGPDANTGACDSGRPCVVCVDGNWDSWSSWSLCTVSCNDGLVKRTRLCNDPAPNYCGIPCSGMSTDLRTQQCGPPKINGGWSTWSSWSECSASCGIGSILRSRDCNNPVPKACGDPCHGATDERVTCSGTGNCNCQQTAWSPWAPWTACSATCGHSIRSRSRECRVVVPGNNCGLDCPDHHQEDVVCTNLPACATSWGQWSACSVTCRGQGFRERMIVVTRPVRRGDIIVETNETRLEREECFVTSPECPTWGQWSACSATCRGQGVRVRIISSSSMDVTTGEITVESNATKTEVQNCIVTEPECLFGDAVWSSWDNWCPCDCRQGVQSRRRECEKVSLQGLEPQKVSIAMCQGEARNEKHCDTKLHCPECVMDCAGLSSGLYPSCLSCTDYISCQQDQTFLTLQCNPVNTEWDAFVKSCVTPPSPSCSLHQCISSCTDKVDGTYHLCGTCNSYIECNAGRLIRRQCLDPQTEWNQQRKRCEVGKSPTCMRKTLIGANMFSTIIGGGLQRDDSQSGLHNNEHDDKETRKPNIALEENHPQNQQSKDTSKVANCKTHCNHADTGKYPSCRGCEHYVICTKDGQLQHKRCGRGRNWDDKTKGCRYLSSTCTRGR